MTTQTEALKLALEELENCADLLKVFEAPVDSCIGAAMLGAENAVTAIKEALAQPEQEPTRWWTKSVIDKDEMDEHFRKRIDVYADQHPTLLVNQLARRLRQAWNTTPPQRKPLTDEEPTAQCTNSDLWNCKYCKKIKTCKAINDHRNFGNPEETEQEPVELNKSGIQKLLKQSGFNNATPEETAAFISGIRHREAEMLDTTPPNRKPLTDEQIATIWYGFHDREFGYAIRFAREVEAAHGIKE